MGMKGKSANEILFSIFIISVCTFMFLIVAYPLYFIIIASISDSTLVSTGKVYFIPKGISLFGYKEIFQDTTNLDRVQKYACIHHIRTFINLLFTLPAAYVLSRKEFRARRFIMFFFVVTLFFNGGLIPTYLLMKGLHLTNTMGVFIFPFSCECVLSDYRTDVFRKFFTIRIV